MSKIFCVFALVATLLPYPLAAAPPDPFLTQIDSQASYRGTDFTAKYTIVQKRADQGESTTVLTIFRRDSEDKFVLVLLEPESDKGKGVLRIGNGLWKYFPQSRRFEVTSAKDQLQNSSIRFSDFNASTLAKDYRIAARGSETLGKLSTTTLTLEAVNNDVTFPKVKLWVTPDNLIRQRQDFSLSGKLLRTTAIPSYAKYASRSVPLNLVILDELSGKTVAGTFVPDRTVVSISGVDFTRVGDLTFSQAYLERLGR